MIQKLRTYWEGITSLGTSRDMSPGMIYRLRLSNQVATICTLATFSYGLLFLYFFEENFYWAAFLECGFFVFTFYLSYKRKDLAAPLWLVFVISLYVFVFASFLGRDAGSHLVLLPILFGIPTMLDLQRVRILLAFLSIPAITFIGLEISDYQLLKDVIVFEVDPQFIGELYVLNLSIALFCAWMVLHFNYKYYKAKLQTLHQREVSLLQTSRLGKIAFCELDMETRKVIWSPELKEMLGVSLSDDPDLEECLSWIDLATHPEVVSLVNETPTEETELILPIRLRHRKDDRELHLTAMAKVWPSKEGKTPRVTVGVRDISFEREQEVALQAEKERAVAANLAKTHFLTNMSHEIRTPLNGILGFTDLLLKSHLPEEQLLQIQHIKYSGDTLLMLLSDLLDLSKIEAGKLQLEEKNFDFHLLANSCLQPYKAQAKEKGISLNWDLDEQIPQYLYSDPVRIKQILINLVSNAIKYTHDGNINLSCTAIFEEDGEDFFTLEGNITDSGIGVPEEEQEEIFKLFNRSSKTNAAEYGGTGVGLAIVSELTQIMKGRVWVKSPVFMKPRPHGSCFSFRIRVQRGQALQEKILRQTNSETSSTLPLYNLRVLLAEDNEINQLLAQKIIQDMGAHLFVVENGQEAVAFVQQHQVDLILMDIKMPIMNGYAATREIRKTHPEMPIVALSANAYKEDLEASQAAGLNGHISKPFKAETLVEVITNLKLLSKK